MAISGIGTAGYPARTDTRGTQKTTSDERVNNQICNMQGQKKGYTVYMKTDDMLYSGGNGTGLSFYIKYAENSTEEDPTVVAKGVDENGNEFEQTIHINKINPTCATVVEMRALESYLNVDKGGGLSSLPLTSGGYGEMGLNDRGNFIAMFEKAIKDMKTLGRFDLMSFYMRNMDIYVNWVKDKQYI